jgi:predicted anti-sigma-YlaC factor YlaD
MMNCKSVKENLVSFLEDDLPKLQRKEMEDHLKFCPHCSRLLEEFSRVWETWGGEKRLQASPYFWTRLRQRIVDYEEKGNPVWSWLEGLVGWARPALGVALLSVCVFLGYSLGNLPRVNDQTTSQTEQRTIALKQLFGSYNLSLLDDVPTGSIEAKYLDVISGE